MKSHSYILGGLDEKKLKVKMKIPYDNFDFKIKVRSFVKTTLWPVL